MRRRTFLRGAGATSASALTAGCASSGDTSTPEPGENEVLVGPNNDFSFAPDPLTVSVGTTVTWTFESPGHNVSCKPGTGNSASLPEGAEPFASYEGDNSFQTLPQGATYEHTVEVPGTYEYVCVPHVANGMVATLIVEA